MINARPPYQDLLYLISRGCYTLPQSIETLHLSSCFGATSPTHHSRLSRATPKSDKRVPYVSEEEQYRFCTQAALADISERYAELSVFNYSDNIFDFRSYGRGRRYHKTSSEREDGGAVWEHIY